jgi:serine/threonine protein kinase
LRTCPQCKTQFGDEVLHCPNDGARLEGGEPVDELIGATIGSYRITKVLGKGGMGAVYAATHPVIGSKVAIKFLHRQFADEPKIVDRFFNEARAVNIIGHDNVLKILDLNATPDNRHYFIMEFLQGRALQSMLEGGAPVPFEVTGPILLQVCAALQAAHDKGIIHRDLKPDNIYLITHNGRKHFVKVVDFGIAKLTDQAAAQGAHTQAGVVMGTPLYMSPEQASGEVDRIDGRSDVYSLGVIMYQLATGQLPFPGSTFAEILLGHLQKPVPPPRGIVPEISPEHEQVILKALAKPQAERFQSMNELHDAIFAAMQAQGIGAELPLADGEEGEAGGSGPTSGPSRGTTAPRGTAGGSGTPRSRQSLPPTGPTVLGKGPARSRLPLILGGAGLLAVVAVGGLWALSGRSGAVRAGAAVPAGGAAQASPAGAAGAPGVRDPDKAGALVKQSSQLQMDGDTGAARDLLEQAIVLDPDNAEAHFRLGRLFHQTQPQRARAEYERARKLNPDKYGAQVGTALGTLQ